MPGILTPPQRVSRRPYSHTNTAKNSRRRRCRREREGTITVTGPLSLAALPFISPHTSILNPHPPKGDIHPSFSSSSSTSSSPPPMAEDLKNERRQIISIFSFIDASGSDGLTRAIHHIPTAAALCSISTCGKALGLYVKETFVFLRRRVKA